MMTRKTSKAAVVQRKRRPLIVLSLEHQEQLAHGILGVARKFEWDLLDLAFWGGAIPSYVSPTGAIVKCLATDALGRKLRKMGCPLVRIGMLPHPLDNEVPAVLADVSAHGRVAAEHFAERGFRDIAFVGNDPWSTAREVYHGLRERANELGCACHLLRLQRSATSKQGCKLANHEWRARLITDWLADLPKPIGVLGYHDQMAGTIVAACCSAGLAVPEEVAVLGRGNDNFCCEVAPVLLSSIDPNAEEHGRQAALLLNRLMNNGEVPEEPLLIPPRRVIERYSTEILAVPDPMVATAMRFLWDNLDIDLAVTDVAEEMKVSRRKLERGFRKCLGRGVNAELRRKRLERCCDILRSTDLTIAEIAPRVGFGSKNYLHQAFRKAFGVSPGQYRQHHPQDDSESK